MTQQIFGFAQVTPAKNIECVYVWITKEKESDSLCSYSFVAEVYQRNALSKHLAAVRSEEGTIEIDKRIDKWNAADDIRCMSGEPASSICNQILSELQDSLWQRNYPNSRFLAFCTPVSETPSRPQDSE